MSMVPNVPEFWMYQGKQRFKKKGGGASWVSALKREAGWNPLMKYGLRIYQNNSWICLIISRCLISLNIPEYAWICLNMPEWLLFYISPFPHLFCNLLSTGTRDYLFERLQETRYYSLKDHEAFFLKRQNLTFFYSSWKCFICFLF